MKNQTADKLKTHYKTSVIIEKDEKGYYAYCPELEGCQTQGNTFEEVLANIKEAIELYLETLAYTVPLSLFIFFNQKLLMTQSKIPT